MYDLRVTLFLTLYLNADFPLDEKAYSEYESQIYLSVLRLVSFRRIRGAVIRFVRFPNCALHSRSKSAASLRQNSSNLCHEVS